MLKKRTIILLAVVLLVVLGGAIVSLPPVWARVSPKVEEARTWIQFALDPPGQEVFVPGQETDSAVATAVQATLLAQPTATLSPTPSGPTATPQPSATPTIQPTPLPQQVNLRGVKHEYQLWNNCGPATLAMALSYWKWDGNQKVTAAYLKPVQGDKNVMPYEMLDYILDETDLRGVVRMGGTLDLLKKLLAAGYPVVVEKGFTGRNFDGWMGHYEVLTGYDDARQVFIAQDSYISPDLDVPYADLESNWRAFNFIFLVIYPQESEAGVMQLLGDYADPAYAFRAAFERSSNEVYALSGRDQYFAWYNRGTSLVNLQDYAGAAESYDQAFAIYPTIEQADRPWRMLWYQTGPYFAYYHSGRYLDVLTLATVTIEEAIKANTKDSMAYIEESFYWRGLAQEAAGNVDAAIEDYRYAVNTLHPGFVPALQALERLGVQP